MRRPGDAEAVGLEEGVKDAEDRTECISVGVPRRFEERCVGLLDAARYRGCRIRLEDVTRFEGCCTGCADTARCDGRAATAPFKDCCLGCADAARFEGRCVITAPPEDRRVGSVDAVVCRLEETVSGVVPDVILCFASAEPLL